MRRRDPHRRADAVGETGACGVALSGRDAHDSMLRRLEVAGEIG